MNQHDHLDQAEGDFNEIFMRDEDEAEDEAVLSALDYEAIEVKCLLLEPQDYVSIYGVLGAGEESAKNSPDMDDVPSRSGMPDLNMAQEGEGKILKKEKLHMRPNEVEVEKFQAHNDLSGTCEDYLLDVEFAEISSDMDSGSSRGSQMSHLKSYFPLSSSSKIDSLGMSGPSGAMVRVADSQNCGLDPTNSELHGIYSHEYGCEASVVDKWSKYNSFIMEAVSGLSTDHVFSDKDDTELFLCHGLTCGGTLGAPFKEYGDSTIADQDAGTENLCKGDELHKSSTTVSSADLLPPQKRPRKPTRRYVEESAELMSISKRKVTSSASKDKFLRDKRRKDNHTKQGTIKLLSEESTAKPIQVPFGPLVGGEQSKGPPSSAVGPVLGGEHRNRHPSSAVGPVLGREHSKRNLSSAVGPVVGREHSKRNLSSAVGPVVGREHSKRHPSGAAGPVVGREHGKRHPSTAVSPLVGGERGKRPPSTAVRAPNSDDESSKDEWENNCLTKVKSEEDRVRRKHHRLWTIAEVKKLLEGVAQYGVGKWSDIKSQFFSSSEHRTPVDLKDKWRNLLKASRLQTRGDSKRSLSWRPLPKSVLNRVSELAAMYPYPRILKSKVSRVQHISSPISVNTDATPNSSRRNVHYISGT